MSLPEGQERPDGIVDALRQIADWMDEADRLINIVFATHDRQRTNVGDQVQQDLRALAVWFHAHPDAAEAAWDHIAAVTGDPTPGEYLERLVERPPARRRLAECVRAWPDAESGDYHPSCCRFPKSCSPYPYDEQIAAGIVELEPER